MRSCTFPAERHAPRQRSSKQSKGFHESLVNFDTNPEVVYDMDTAGRSISSVPSESSHDNLVGSVGTDLNDTMMTTVVSNGNDALNLLFEAAQSEERGAHTTRAKFPEEEPLAQFSTSPKAPTMSTTIHLLPTLSAQLLDTWNTYRFVRMRWLSAEEIVWLLDKCVDLLRPCSAVLKLC
jgi:hypothetical protein